MKAGRVDKWAHIGTPGERRGALAVVLLWVASFMWGMLFGWPF